MAEYHGDRRSQGLSPPRGGAGIALMLIGMLAGCAAGGPKEEDGRRTWGGYPALGSVPATSRPNLPIEERRQIVRELIEQRDRSREHSTLVRRRSGLGVAPSSDRSQALAAEDIVPDAPAAEDEGFRLKSDEEVSADSVYRDRSQFDDGGLDDFIRQLKQDTRPQSPSTPAAPAAEPDDDDLSALPTERRMPRTTPSWPGELTEVRLAAFAPVLAERPAMPRDAMIRLAAGEGEPGFFCGRLGWLVAWSSICVSAEAADPDPEVGADLEQDLELPADDMRPRGADRSAGSDVTESDAVERRLSEEDAAEAIEDAGRNALAPVAESLEKLREFVRSRRSGEVDASSPEQRPALRRSALPPDDVEIEPPPVPKGRPELREDITITEDGEVFRFVRTPTPAFKPSRERQAAVILPPEGRQGASPNVIDRVGPPPRPAPRPADLVPRPAVTVGPTPSIAAAQADLSPSAPPGAEAAPPPAGPLASSIQPAARQSEEPVARSAASSASDDDAVTPPSESETALAVLEQAKTEGAGRETEPGGRLSYLLIAFAPETPGLPEGSIQQLSDLLADAKASGRKIHVVGEASTNHLARRRATDVGAALVQLGATVEILEYDHAALAGVDQVRLLLKPAAPGQP